MLHYKFTRFPMGWKLSSRVEWEDYFLEVEEEHIEGKALYQDVQSNAPQRHAKQLILKLFYEMSFKDVPRETREDIQGRVLDWFVKNTEVVV